MNDERIIKPTKKITKLRVIDKGTNYDVPGKLKRLSRRIEHGEMGRVSTLIVGVLSENTKGEFFVTAHHYGTGDGLRVDYVIEKMKERFNGR